MSLHEERIAAAVAVLEEVGAGRQFTMPDGVTAFRGFIMASGAPLHPGQYPLEPQAGTTVTVRVPLGKLPANANVEGSWFSDDRGFRYRVEREVLRPDSVMVQLECTVSKP
jgi:hypothetical protein